MTNETLLKVALFQPDIPQNVGAMMRLCACMDIPMDVIEPCGFVWDSKKMNRPAMDYKSAAQLSRYKSWDDFSDKNKNSRILLMTTKASVPYYDFEFQPGDILLAGRESAGAPDHVHEQAEGRICIPMANGTRSLNIVNASAMIVSEALRQLKWSKQP